MVRANARHILVETREACEKIKAEIAGGADFAEMAQQHSQCPSSRQGGELGEFGPGEMVPEFDAVVFSGEIGEVYGPIETKFGYHLIEITDCMP
jgi:peptidyl-prolyl cis-trans isomerase C